MIQVGARVRIRPKIITAHRNLHPGDTGTVVSRETGNWLGVHFDRFFGGHNCDGKCPQGHGWMLPEGEFEELPPDSQDFLEWCELDQADDVTI